MSVSPSRKPANEVSAATTVLVSCAIMICWLPFQLAARTAEARAAQSPLLFLGNASLPPMCFMKDGRPTGIVVDLADAMATRMREPFEIQLMDWSEAQQRVQDGRAAALLQINPNPERLLDYDFSDPLLTSEFTIFTSADRLGVTSLDDLRGLKVGVEQSGLPISLLKENPQIQLVIIRDFLEGFRMLSAGALDAVIADRLVGCFVLADNHIEGVRLIQEPIARSQSAIAVKKGDGELLRKINAALADIRQDGAYDRILKSWQPADIVFRTHEQVRQQAWLTTAILAAFLVAVVSLVVLARETRKRKRVEVSLRAAEERFRLFMDNSPTIAWLKDEDGRHVYFNKTFAEHFGISLDEGRGKTDFELWPPDIAELFHENDKAVLAAEHPIQVLEEAASPDGSRRYWLSSKFPFQDATGAWFVGGVGADVTERRNAEEALRLSEERYRILVETANEGIWSMDEDHVTTYVNRAMADMLGYSVTEMLGTKVEAYFYPEDSSFHSARMTKRHAGEDEVYQRRFRRRDGSELWTLVSAKALRDGVGRFLGSFAMFVDITEQKKAEIALRDSLEEKVSLLKEVHHRVKNNLQIVASLLGLQLSRSRSQEVQDVLQDTRNRVKSMALLHETLYRSENLACINFATYVKDLCGQLMVAYGQIAKRVTLEQRVEPIGLALDQAVPCGLIVSELMSNALKHGFPENRSGRVVVVLARRKDRQLLLSVTDDGVGLPSGWDLTRTSTLGLQLVTRLAGQLRGRMEAEGGPDAGATFRVLFPEPPGDNQDSKS